MGTVRVNLNTPDSGVRPAWVARRGAHVSYDVVSETGPPHDRTFEVAAMLDGEQVGRGEGRSKKTAEQAAAEEALERLDS